MNLTLKKAEIKKLLAFIDLFDPHHFFIEPEIVEELKQKSEEVKE